jgi:hypothetical protein
MHAFQACALNRSAISPPGKITVAKRGAFFNSNRRHRSDDAQFVSAAYTLKIPPWLALVTSF